MVNKQAVIDLLKSAQRMQSDLANYLVDDERKASGNLKDWAFKEIVGHVSIWIERHYDNIQAVQKGEQIANYDNYLELNDQDFVKFQAMTWQDVQTYATKVSDAYLAMLEALAEDDLKDTRFSESGNSPLWQQVVSYVFTHPLLHYSDVYAQRAELGLANQIQEAAAQTLAELDPSERWQGVVTYNLACHYATSRQPQPAIDKLSQALKLRPDLVEWSKQDPDFDSLRQEVDYQALYQ